MKIERLFVQGFLGVAEVNVTTTQAVHLFAGANGAGKSSVRDAVALALTSDLGRVGLKKEAGQLVNSRAQHAVCEVENADGDRWSVTISQAGKIVDSQKGRDNDPVLACVLDAQRFASMDATARRAFLFDLMGVKADAVTVRQLLLQRGSDGHMVDRVLPLLRAGFPAACEEAKAKATAAKGAWRAVTGETFGSEKAKTWRAAQPVHDPAVGTALATELKHADVALEQWQRQVGQLMGQQQHRQQQRGKLGTLREQVAMLERLQTKLAADQSQLQHWAGELERTKAAVAGGAAQRVGLVHDLAKSVHALLMLGRVDRDSVVGMDAERALQAYTLAHGDVVRGGSTAGGDSEARQAAQAKLPEVERAHDLLARSVVNTQRDLGAAQRAQAEAGAIEAELAEPFDEAALADATAQVEKMKAGRAETVRKMDAQRALKAQADAAEKKTSDAAAHAAEVDAWDVIAKALAPDGIPADLLARALQPMNERLAQSAADAQWPQVQVTAEMVILYGARPYALLSESEQWRCDAMLAEAVAQISGTRLLVLDRFDVLDLPGRADLIAWLDVLADNGEIDTALIFGTLKQLPANLPGTFAAHWLQAGALVDAEQQKEAA